MNTYQKTFIACALLLALTNFCAVQKANVQKLVTESQECFLKNFTHVTSEVIPLVVSIDLPVKGPQPLMDSLTVFLNETLYHYFDNDDDRHLSYQTVYSKDLERLVEHYRDACRPFFLADSSYMHEFTSDCLEMKLVAQNDAYVTYEVDWIFFGDGEEVAKEWVTFVLSDGHRLKEIISNKNMLRFYKKYPKLRNGDIWDHCRFNGNESYLKGEVGLLNDSVAHQYTFVPGIFEEAKYPLAVIAPFLSKETRQLIDKR